ncbi:MAG: DegT/DnrJ/EryC1/StrS aminotransferase [Nitrospira sp.]|jgi:dTDP-4-amino-4,6-dideoxygalactose transaminase|nr:MAG: DegT/DnrJ/EryC1/StrS aminotransferase [Nitrospira sp.]
MNPIPITKPVFGEPESRALLQPIDTGWVVQGPFVRRFEEHFSAFTGARHSIATTSCTTALHLAVVALGVQPGDEVIVPAFTWVATANVVECLKARPVFCDVDLKTFNIDVGGIEPLITSRTVGIIAVHLFGLCADMAPILDIAKRHGLWVVEDAACAFGSEYRGRHAGTFGEVGCFSFHPRKSITTGEGGMLTTQRADLDRLVRSLRDHGAARSDYDRHTGQEAFLLADFPHVGYNYRMTDIQGALGCAQMERAKWILDERSKRARYYDRALASSEWLQVPAIPEGYVHGYQAYVCLFRPEVPALANTDAMYRRRNAIMTRLEQRGISTRQGTHAAALTQYYSGRYGIRPEQFPDAYMAERLTLTLPLYAQMTEEDQERVVTELQHAFREL